MKTLFTMTLLFLSLFSSAQTKKIGNERYKLENGKVTIFYQNANYQYIINTGCIILESKEDVDSFIDALKTMMLCEADCSIRFSRGSVDKDSTSPKVFGSNGYYRINKKKVQKVIDLMEEYKLQL